MCESENQLQLIIKKEMLMPPKETTTTLDWYLSSKQTLSKVVSLLYPTHNKFLLFCGAYKCVTWVIIPHSGKGWAIELSSYFNHRTIRVITGLMTGHWLKNTNLIGWRWREQQVLPGRGINSGTPVVSLRGPMQA